MNMRSTASNTPTTIDIYCGTSSASHHGSSASGFLLARNGRVEQEQMGGFVPLIGRHDGVLNTLFHAVAIARKFVVIGCRVRIHVESKSLLRNLNRAPRVLVSRTTKGKRLSARQEMSMRLLRERDELGDALTFKFSSSTHAEKCRLRAQNIAYTARQRELTEYVEAVR